MQQNNWFYRLPPAGTPSLLQKRGRVLIARLPLHKAIRRKNRRTNNVGAHRCVRPKYTQAMRNRADTPVCPYGKKTNKHKKEKNL